MDIELNSQQASTIKLDIGCGPRKVSSEYIGLDLLRHSNIDILASATALPFKNDSFIEVYTRRCIQHIPNEENVLSEVFRVLQKDGQATFIVASWTGWIFYKFRWLLKNGPYQIFHFYSFKKLVQMLKKNKFQLLSIGKIKSIHKFGYDIIAKSKKEDNI